MQFGKQAITEIIDDEGSTLTIEHSYIGGTIAKPTRKRYEIRYRTDKTDLMTISKIAQSLIEDPTKLDTAIRFEPSRTGDAQGYHHIVECYTVLNYGGAPE